MYWCPEHTYRKYCIAFVSSLNFCRCLSLHFQDIPAVYRETRCWNALPHKKGTKTSLQNLVNCYQYAVSKSSTVKHIKNGISHSNKLVRSRVHKT